MGVPRQAVVGELLRSIVAIGSIVKTKSSSALGFVHPKPASDSSFRVTDPLFLSFTPGV